MTLRLLESLPAPVALVCGSGALNAAAQVGMLAAVQPWRPDIVVGSSGGALTASAVAVAPDDASGRARTAWTTFADSPVMDLGWRRLFSAVAGRDTSRQTRQLEKLLGELFGEHEFATDGTQGVVTTNLSTGRAELLTTGAIAKAVQAATAFPVIANPVQHNGDLWVDGSFSASLPVAQAFEMGAAAIVALDTGRASLTATQEQQIRWWEVAMVSVGHQVAANAAHDVAMVAQKLPIVVLSVTDPFRVAMADIADRMTAGEEQARQQLEGLGAAWEDITEPGVYSVAAEVVTDRRLRDLIREPN